MFHDREKKPGWWAIFDSFKREDDELIDDLDALADLVATGPAVPVKRSLLRTYTFPEQETKIRAGQSATIPTLEGFETVNVEELDGANKTISLKVGLAKASCLENMVTLHPGPPIGTDNIKKAIRDVIEDQCGQQAYKSVDDLLSRSIPRLNGRTGDILGPADIVAETIDAITAMNDTVLPIQGPPGTGKTYVTARAILSLAKKGFRVGVTSNSHEAIRNVLLGCVAASEEQGGLKAVEILHKVSDNEYSYPDLCPVQCTTSDQFAALNGNIIGGTAFFFARDENIQLYDWLFVDEAGQVSLANMVAMGRAARNIVLVGDPQQLPQVIQGAHPYPANLSCLQWLLTDNPTVPPERGIFLPTTWRMHSAVCKFISDHVYESRLHSDPANEKQAIIGTNYPSAGAFWVPVVHDGNAQVSHEEADAIEDAIENICKGKWTNKQGHSRPIVFGDIIVVAPYNAQVNCLMERLPPDIKVGTVDKLQGQEAPVCIVSMTASSAEETSRGMEFLLSLNRINVAVSRAKALVLVFGSDRLRETKCVTITQMQLVNTLCALRCI